MTDENPLDSIVDELVVFRHEDPNHHDGQYFSNHPMWNDSRIREHWMARHSEEAIASGREEAVAGDRSDRVVPNSEDSTKFSDDYAQWTNDDLRAELNERSLDVDGKKAELIARLRADDAEGNEDDEVE